MKKSLLIIAGIAICILSNAETHKKGLISGETWTKPGSPYIIDSAIRVASLTIEPGVIIRFAGNYVFQVDGILTAIGTSCDSIKFTRTSAAGWRGILFQNSLPGTVMAWCIIENANTSGIRIFESFPKIYNCDIRNNKSSNSGGGLKISNTNNGVLEISYCTIEGNVTSAAASNGAGVWVNCKHGTTRFKNCIIKNNQAIKSNANAYGGGAFVQGKVEFILCNIENNFVGVNADYFYYNISSNGGGIYIKNGNVNFLNTIINKNNIQATAADLYSSAYAYGGGVDISSGQVSFLNSIITNNTAYGAMGTQGGGLLTNVSSITIENCTFGDNNPYGIYNNATDTLHAVNSIIYFNNNNNQQVTGKIGISYSDVQNGYPGKGNINFSPLFQGNGVYKIVPPSPCIDAGNTAQQYKDACFPPSLGNSRNDMGAHGGPQACTWNDCGYTASVSIVNANHSCKYGKIKIDLFGALNSINLKLYDSSNNLIEQTNLRNCVTTYTFDSLVGGNYTININNVNNCKQNYTARVKCPGASEAPLSFANNKIFSVNSLAVYPNPTKGFTTIKLNLQGKSNCEVLITDVTGRIIKREQISLTAGENSYNLNLANNTKGTYLLRIKTSADVKIIKLIKE